MPIYYAVGDATLPIAKPAIIVHVVNDIGAWGAGFSGAIGRRFPWAARDYLGWDNRKLGLLLVSVSTRRNRTSKKKLVVGHLCAQHRVRSRTNPKPIDLNALRNSLSKLRIYLSTALLTYSVHMPRIGCGLAGGTWDEVEPLVSQYLSKYDVYVYDLPDDM